METQGKLLKEIESLKEMFLIVITIWQLVMRPSKQKKKINVVEYQRGKLILSNSPVITYLALVQSQIEDSLNLMLDI